MLDLRNNFLLQSHCCMDPSNNITLTRLIANIAFIYAQVTMGPIKSRYVYVNSCEIFVKYIACPYGGTMIIKFKLKKVFAA